MRKKRMFFLDKSSFLQSVNAFLSTGTNSLSPNIENKVYLQDLKTISGQANNNQD